MLEQKNRRDFLKLSAAGLAAFLSNATNGLQPAFGLTTPQSSKQVSIWNTSATGVMVQRMPSRWVQISGEAPNDLLVVNPETRYQSILGFGGAFTDAACVTLNKMPNEQRDLLLTELFSPGGLNLSVCRTCIGASDYATKAYTYDDGAPDPELKRFSIAHDQETILPILLAARKINPSLFLFASPWSPPGWMKSNNSMLGGNMQRKYMEAYANYFVKFLKAYESAGVPIQAVTVQNEVDTDQDGAIPACIWPQEYEADFVRNYLGPAFERDGIKSKIWLVDHNYNLWGRAIAELETPNVRKYASGIAWHGYVGDPAWMTRVHTAAPEVDMFWTEGGPDYTDKNYLTDWSKWGTTFSGILKNWCRSLTAWNLALDESGKPNIGPFPCGGLVTVDSKSHEIKRSGQYAAIAHFSKFVQPGAVRIDSNCTLQGFQHVAFENPNKQRVVVVTNPGHETEIVFRLKDQVAEISLMEDSITTVVWD